VNATLKGKMNFERPKNFHLVLSHMATGKEVDLGSNADGFWFWTKQSPEFYVCNYDATGNIPGRDHLPAGLDRRIPGAQGDPRG
jgi:hypothetical protein